MKRVCIYPKDVSLLTGKSLRHAQKMLQSLKIVLQKSPNQYVTIEEFAVYTGIAESTIQKNLAG